MIKSFLLFAVKYDTLNNHCTISGSGDVTKSGFQVGNYLYTKSVEITGQIQRINESAFFGCFNLQKVTFSAPVISLGYRSFYQCYSLGSIIFSETLEEVSIDCFYQCNALNTLKFPNSFKIAYDNSFSYISGLKTVEFDKQNSQLTTLKEFSFAYCIELSSFVLPNSLQKIEQFSFYGTKLTTFNIPVSLNYIVGGSFANTKCILFTNDGNSKYIIENEAVVDSTTNTIISYPSGRSGHYSMLDTIKAASTYCFSGSLIESLRLSSGMTETPYRLCNDCYSLKNVTNAENIKIFGSNTFSNCRAMDLLSSFGSPTTISSECFYRCWALKMDTLPNTVLSIGDRAFFHCLAITKFSLPDSLKKLGAEVFKGASNLEYAYIPAGLVEWKSGVFALTKAVLNISSENLNFIEDGGIIYNKTFTGIVHVDYQIETATLKEEYIILGQSAFSGLAILKSLKISSKTKGIQSNCFAECPLFEEINIPPTLEFLSEYAFWKCKSLKTITFPENCLLYSIGTRCFEDSRIESIIVPKSVTKIGDFIFRACIALKNVTIYPSFTSYLDMFLGCTALASLQIGSEIIPSQSCAQLLSLTNVTILNTVKQIEPAAFYKNINLETISFEDNCIITKISSQAFSECGKIKSVILPSSIIDITASSFSGCYLLRDVRFEPVEESNFISIEGGVYSKDEKQFILCPPGRNKMNIKETVKVIGYQGFYGCKYLTEVTLGVQLEEILPECFYGCTSITMITIPEKIQKIGEKAFGDCSKLSIVLYCGLSDGSIIASSNPFDSQSIIYVNEIYSGNKFCGKEVVKSSSQNPDTKCPNVPTIIFTHKRTRKQHLMLFNLFSFLFLNAPCRLFH